MKSIKELINVRSLMQPSKKAKTPLKTVKVNLTTDMDIDAAGLREVKKINEWFQRPGNKLKSGYKILFDGSSAAAKTKAVKLIARQNGVDVYRVKLSEIVSKNIAETEKNLNRVLTAAEAGGGILFFDEADAVFGKRSTVKDSHDKYANIEVNYLLQRLEKYKGMAILNCKECSGLDKALAKYFQGVVHFPGSPVPKAINERPSLSKKK